MSNLESELKRLKNLKQNQDMPEEMLQKQAIINCKIRDFKKDHSFVNKAEEKDAIEIFERFVGEYEFDNISDLDNLGNCVYNMILLKRLEKGLTDFYKQQEKEGQNKVNSFYNDKLATAKQDLEKHILLQKQTLGITKEQKEEDLTVLQKLKKRFHKYIQENKNEFTIAVPFKCKECGREDVQLHLLRKKVKDFDVMEHPWFVGRWLCNFQILKDVKEGKLSKQDAVRYLMSSGKGKDSIKAKDTYCEDYILWCLCPDNWKKIEYLMNDN